MVTGEGARPPYADGMCDEPYQIHERLRDYLKRLPPQPQAMLMRAFEGAHWRVRLSGAKMPSSPPFRALAQISLADSIKAGTCYLEALNAHRDDAARSAEFPAS